MAVPLTLLRLGGQGAEFLGWVVLARHLGATSFGRVSVAFLVCRYAGLVADWGAAFRGARDLAAAAPTAEVSALLRLRFRIAIALSAVYLASASASGNGELAPMVAVIISYGWSRDWLALGREQGARSSLPLAARGLLVLGAAFLAHTAGQAAMVVALGYGVGTLASLLLNPFAHEVGGQRRRMVDAWMLVAVVMAQVYTSLDTMLLASLRSTREAGIYAAVYRIPLAWVTFVGLLVTAFIPVATSALRDDPAQLPVLRRQAVRAGLAGAGIVLASVPVLVPMVTPLFGRAFQSGRLPLALILVATAVSTLSAPLGALYLGVGRDRDFALVLAAGAGINVLANLVAIPRFGMNGAAATTVASESLVLVGLAVLISRR